MSHPRLHPALLHRSILPSSDHLQQITRLRRGKIVLLPLQVGTPLGELIVGDFLLFLLGLCLLDLFEKMFYLLILHGSEDGSRSGGMFMGGGTFGSFRVGFSC